MTTQNKKSQCKTNSPRNYNPLDTLLSKLDKVKQNGAGKWIACCPAHDDKSPSLAIKADGDRVFNPLFSGCETADVLAAIGMTFADLMPEKLDGHNYPREKKPFYSSDILKIISHEAKIVYLCAVDISHGKSMDAAGTARLSMAMSRINHAVEVSTHGL